MELKGRSLGTERPSGSAETEAQAGGFAPFLAPEVAASASERVIDGVAARIRGGRTDAANEAPERAPVARDAEDVRTERGEAARDAEARRTARTGERTGSDRPTTEHRAPQAGGGETSRTSRPHAAASTDPSQARGASESASGVAASPAASPSESIAGANGAGSLSSTVPAALSAAASIANPAAAAATLPPAARSHAGGRIDAVPATRLESASARVARPAAAAHSGRASAMERAEAILDQLRVRIQSGQREATIELKPLELGRIRMHVRAGEGTVTAVLGAERAETLAVLEAHAPELRAWLARDGAEQVELRLELLEDRGDGQPRAGTEGRSPSGGEGDSGRGRSSAAADDGTSSAASPLGAAPEALLRALTEPSADRGVDLVA